MIKYLEYPHIWFFLRWYKKVRTWHNGVSYVMADNVKPSIDFDCGFVKPYLTTRVGEHHQVVFYDHPSSAMLTSDDIQHIERLEATNKWPFTVLYHAVSSFDDHNYVIAHHYDLKDSKNKSQYSIYSRLNGTLCLLSCPNIKGRVLEYDRYFTTTRKICTLSKWYGKIDNPLQLTLFDAQSA